MAQELMQTLAITQTNTNGQVEIDHVNLIDISNEAKQQKHLSLFTVLPTFILDKLFPCSSCVVGRVSIDIETWKV